MSRLDYAQARAEMSSGIPRGVGAPPPAGLDPKRGKLVCIKVRMLDDTVAVFHLGHKALGQSLLDEVSRHLNLLENDYFGLEFIDSMRNRCWLDKDKPILRQIAATGSDAKFYFIVKFYSPNPVDLEEEYTRYLFTLQIRRDLSLGELHCAESTAALLAAYLVQSDCGDFSSDDYLDASYLSHSRFVPNQTMEFQQKVMDNHRNLVGMSPGESDLALLEVARRCDFYGIKFHQARDIEGTQASLSVMHLGIKVFHQLHCVSTFSWAKIRKLSFKRKKLLIKLHPDSYQFYKETIEFVFDTRNECKNLWKKCVEHHAFFRCSAADGNRKDGKLFSKGSSFRYHGRTQKQLIDYVREHHKRREPFTRPLRSAGPARSTYSATYSAVGERRRNGRTTASMPHLPNDGALDARARRRESGGDRATSDHESRERPRREKQQKRETQREREPVVENMSLSLPNVLSDDIHVVCRELEIESKDPPKSASGDNFLELTSRTNDYDNISEDSYRLSDHERSTRSEQVYNTTFTTKRVGNVIVKRVVSQCKSTPATTDDEDASVADSAPPSRRQPIKEYPFHGRQMVPIEIDGPNVDLCKPPRPVYTSSGVLLLKPKVLSTEEPAYATVKLSPDSGHYSSIVSPRDTVETSTTHGATGPLPGKVITKDNMVITPEGVKEKRPKPVVPPKPRKPEVPPHAAHPVVHMNGEEPIRSRSEEVEVRRTTPPSDTVPERRAPLSRPALISVQSEDNPAIQKCHLYTSDIPYTLTLRNVECSTYRDEYQSQSLKRTSKSPESFQRRKSLDLVSRNRLPSPGNFSSQDHTISPSTPDSDVLEYLLRRRSMSHERSALSKRGKRGDPRRQTQPVRFDLPPSPASPQGGSTPFISFLPDDVMDDCGSESRSLHDDMERLDKSASCLQQVMSPLSARADSEDSDPLPPPPIVAPPSETAIPKAPPPPPPKSKSAADKVVEIKATTVLTLTNIREEEGSRFERAETVREDRPRGLERAEAIREESSGDSTPFIDDSPKEYAVFNKKKKDVIYGVNSTFSAENIAEPAIKVTRFGLSTSLTSQVDSARSLTRVESSDSGGISLYNDNRSAYSEHSARLPPSLPFVPASPRPILPDPIASRLEPESSSEKSDSYVEREDSLVGRRSYGHWDMAQIVRDFVAQERTAGRDLRIVAKTFYGRIAPLLDKCRVLSDLFSVLNELLDSQRKLLRELEEMVVSTDPSALGGFPQRVLCSAHNATPLYACLVQQYPIYISAIDELSRSNAAFKAELLRVESSEECYVPINWLLQKIIHRIVGWQPMLARLVEFHLEEGLSDTEVTSWLTSSRVACEKASRYGQDTRVKRESLVEYVAMLQMERDLGAHRLLPHPNRRLLRIGRVERWSERGLSPRILLLSSDRLLFAHRSLGDSPFSIHAEVKLKGLLVEDGDTYRVAGGRSDVITLHSGDKSIVLATRDKDLWMEDISSAVKQAAKSRLELPPLQLERKEDNDVDSIKGSKWGESDSPKPRPSPLQVCWHRHATLGIEDIQRLVTVSQSGYLLRKLRNSSGWQRLWVVLACHTMFFFKTHEDDAPLANLPLVDYGLALPSLEDDVIHEHCFKLFYASHRYYFRADCQYTFNRWMDSIRASAISRSQMDLMTSLTLRI